MRTLTMAIALTSLALLAATGIASASFAVSELVVSSSASPSGAQVTFPIGTETVYVVYTYKGAAGETVNVTLDADNLPNLYTSPSKTYRGDGTDSVPIRGIDLYRILASAMEDRASAIKENLSLIQSQSIVQDYLLTIGANASSLRAAAVLVQSLKSSLPAEQASQADDLVAAADDISSTAREAQLAATLEAKRTIAASMQSVADGAVDDAEGIAAHAAAVTAMPLPATAGAAEGYAVQIQVNGDPSRDTEFGVSGTGTSGTGNVDAAGTATAAARSGAQPTTASATRTAASGSTNAVGSTVQNTASGTGGESAVSSVALARSTAMAALRAATLASVTGQLGAATPVGAGSSAGEASLGATVAAPPQGGLDAGQGAAQQQSAAQPTWTMPPDQAASRSVSPGSPPASGESAPKGPNIAVLALGAVALGVVAFWLRQRM